ncbi:hypothetical protein PIIN_06926 [Serendipita indica DSM 11827]|uniref:Uncharacterized protein n=1 Tax=Serendipita indica (strain DSM 11827) TaxID=1109443 RepID=G4TNS8_SERID|nr:hypothetical protein PIIN_06926 [Serendipita indica DSM 11827]
MTDQIHRSQWAFAHAMQLDLTHIHWKVCSTNGFNVDSCCFEAQESHQETQLGPNKDSWMQSSITHFNDLSPRRKERYREDWTHRSSGSEIANIMSQEMIPVKWHQPLLPGLESTSPTVELSTRPPPLSSHWDNATSPLLFAAQPYLEDDAESRSRAISILSAAFHPMINIFVHCHLATRQSQTKELPPWMVLFGVIYDKYMVEIIAFYPTWDGSWQPRALTSGDLRMTLWKDSPRGQLPLVMCLRKIQNHYTSVMRHLQSWPGYDAAVRANAQISYPFLRI